PGANLDGGRRPEERWRGCASGGHGVGSGRRRRRTRRPEHHQRGRARRGDAGWPSRDGLTIRMGAAPEKQGVWDWVKETFRGRGIVLILLALGVVFLLLGLTTGIDLPFLKHVAVNEGSRWFARILGLVLLGGGFAMFIWPDVFGAVVTGSDGTPPATPRFVETVGLEQIYVGLQEC